MAIERDYELSWADVYPARPGRGGDIKVVCPFCRPGSRNPSAKCLSVNQTTGAFMCHDNACEAKGVIAEERERPIGWTAPEQKPRPSEPKVYSRPDLSQNIAPTEKTLAYMESRGVSRETCKKMRIGSKIGHDGREWLAMHYADRSGKNIHHVKYRALDGDRSKGKWTTSKDTNQTFYGLQTLSDHPDTVYITEGEIDALTLIEAGYSNVLSLPGGSNSGRQGKKLDCLPSAEKELVAAKRVILAIDGDEAGEAMMAELVERIGVGKAAMVHFPPEAKDANDYARQFGMDALRHLIDSSRIPQIDGVSLVDDYSDDIWEKRFEENDIGAWAPSMPLLGELFRIPTGLLMTVVGPPGAGKSSFLRALLLAISGSVDDFPVAFFAPEDAAVPRRFFEKFIRLVAGADVRTMNSDQYETVLNVIQERIILVHPDSNSLDDILYRAEYAILNHGIKVLVIDPWTEVVTKREYGDDPVDHINKCLSRMQDFARKKGITIIVSAHPTKEAATSAAKEGRLLDLYSVSGTAGWNNKTDIGISIRRSTEIPESIVTEVHTVKIRDVAYGKLGMVEFSHNPANGQYIELGGKG